MVDIPGQGVGGFSVFHALVHVRILVSFVLRRQHVVEVHALVGGFIQQQFEELSQFILHVLPAFLVFPVDEFVVGAGPVMVDVQEGFEVVVRQFVS